MTAWILRIELRRSVARWAAAVSLPLASLWSQVAEGMSGVVGAQRGELVLLVPVALALGASQARRDRRSGTTELLTTTARPPSQRFVHTAVALGIGAATGHLVVLAGLAAYGAAVGAYMPLFLLAAAVVTALYLVAGVWLGLAVGRAAPSVLVPPLLLVAGMATLLWLSLAADTEGYADTTPPSTLLLAPPTSLGFDAFETLTSQAHLAQVVWATGLAATCLVLCVAARSSRLAAVVPLVLGATVATSLLPNSLFDALTLDRGALALVCTSEEPRICGRRLHPRLVDDLREPGRRALAILSAKLPEAPSRVVEAYHGNDAPARPEPRADTLYVELRTDGAGRLDMTRQDVLWTLLLGAGTLPCPTDTPAAYVDSTAARLAAAAWLLDQAPPAGTDSEISLDGLLPDPTITGPASEAYERLDALPAGEQRARVAALRAAELACDDRDRLDVLTGAAGTR